MSNPLAKLLFKVLRAYDVLVTYHTIEQTILTHPEYPSMQCISDALDRWNVQHVVMKLTFDKLRALNVPVLAHLKKGEYVWVTQITNSKVQFVHTSGREKNDSIDHFELEWSGVVLAVEDVTNAGESNYYEKRNKELKKNIFEYAIPYFIYSK
jgi:ABC-type bacteriocin/lantibiotic exporter with double-glycine peptidase domain